MNSTKNAFYTFLKLLWKWTVLILVLYWSHAIVVDLAGNLSAYTGDIPIENWVNIQGWLIAIYVTWRASKYWPSNPLIEYLERIILYPFKKLKRTYPFRHK
jgi:hypothetical protein